MGTFAGVSDIIKTNDIPTTIKEFARDNELPLKELDFSIAFESDPYESKQMGKVTKNWQIKIMRKALREYQHHPIMRVTPNRENPLICELTFLTQSKFDLNDPNLLKSVVAEIRKVLAYNHIVFGIISYPELEKIAQQIVDIGRMSHSSVKEPALIFPIARGRLRKNGKDSKTEYHFETYNTAGQIDEKGNIDYSKKNFTQHVEDGQLIVTYYRALKGSPGVLPDGKLTPQYVGQTKDTFPFHSVTSRLSVVDRPDRIEVYARQEGFFCVDNNGNADIKDNVTIDGAVDLAVTGDIYFKEDARDVIINHQGVSKDAVGAGRTVQGKNVQIKGNIASNAKVAGENVEIEGTIHRSATIEADEKVSLTLGSGTVRADVVHCDSFQQGTIYARQVFIKQHILNATIYCEEINHHGTMRNAEVFFSGNSAHLGHMVGDENSVHADPTLVPAVNEVLEGYKATMEKDRERMTELSKQARRISSELQKDRSRLEMAMRTVKECKAAGRKIPPSSIAVIQSVRDKKTELEAIVTETETLKVDFAKTEKLYDRIIKTSKEANLFIEAAEEGNRIRFYGITQTKHLNRFEIPIMICVEEGKDEIKVQRQ